MPAPFSFDYSIIRVVPRVEREEFINVGVLLYCRTEECLVSRIELDRGRMSAFAPALCLEQLDEYLATIPLICNGGPGSGPIGALELRARFHWLVAPRSTVVQFSPVHSGVCHDLHSSLEHLLDKMVRVPKREE